MDDLIIKLAKGSEVTEQEITHSGLSATSVIEWARTGNISDKNLSNELYEICESEHASCNSGCPVYSLNGKSIPMNEDRSNCSCFKAGFAMLEFIRTNS